MVPKLSFRALIIGVIFFRNKLIHVSAVLTLRNNYDKYLIAYYNNACFKLKNAKTKV